MDNCAAVSPVRVLVVDDHPAVREAIAMRLKQAKDLIVCGEASDEGEALNLLEKEKPDIAIVDISLRKGSGIDLIKRARAKGAQSAFLVWSMFDEEIYAERALRAGAMGYINKQESTDRILDAIRQIVAGNVYLSEKMKNKLLRSNVSGIGASNRSPLETLSDRELEVLGLIGNGRKTADIARELHLSVKTVETYRDRLRHKLLLNDGAELARYAVQWVLESQR